MSNNIIVEDDIIKALKNQIEAANQRCDAAWNNYDLDAYEGAVETGNRLYVRLKELGGSLDT